MTYFANNLPMRFKRLETVSLLSIGILMEVSPVCSSFSTMESTSWAVASGDFKASAKPERKDIPWATKSFGWFERLVTDSLFEDEFVCCWMEISSFFPGGLLGAVAVLTNCLLIVLCHCYVALFKTFKYIWFKVTHYKWKIRRNRGKLTKNHRWGKNQRW